MGDSSRWQVLLAADEPTADTIDPPWTREMTRLLADERVAFCRAAGTEQTVSRIASGAVDLAVLCGERSGSNGLKTLEVVRSRFVDLPCVLVTPETSSLTLRRAMALRAESVVPHPVDAAVLADVMMRILRKRFSQGH